MYLEKKIGSWKPLHVARSTYLVTRLAPLTKNFLPDKMRIANNCVDICDESPSLPLSLLLSLPPPLLESRIVS